MMIKEMYIYKNMKKLIVIVLISAAFINASKPAPRNFPKKVVFGRSFTEKVDLSKSAKKPAAEKPAAKEKAQPKVIAHILLQKASPQSTYTNILFLQQNVSIIERISVVAKDDKKVELYGQTKGYPPQNFKVSTADQQKFQRIK